MKTLLNHLLYTSDFKQAEAEIMQKGGYVCLQFTDTAFIANLPEGIESSTLKYANSEAPESMDELTAMCIRAWQRNMQESSGDKSLPEKVIKKWDHAEGHYPKNIYNDLQLKEEFEIISKGIELKTGTSDVLTDKISLGIVIVSGKLQHLAISDSEQEIIIAQVLKACLFLSDQGKRYAVSFSFKFETVTIDATPPTQCGDVAEPCESVFRDAALQKLGFNTGYAGCVDYVLKLKNLFGSKWTYMAFFTKYPMFHFGYAGGVRMCIQYANNGWGPEGIHNVFAHETGHIFGAPDEYAGSKCVCSLNGFYSIPNYNCDNCNNSGFIKDICMMKENDLSLCTWTRGHLGWVKPLIFSVRQGSGQKGQLMYSAFDGHNWMSDKRIQESTVSTSPDIVLFKDKILCLYQNAGEHGELFYNTFNLAEWSWEGQKAVAGAHISANPALVVLKDKMYCFYQGSKRSGELYFNTFDGKTWSPAKKVPDMSLSSGPGAVVFKNSIYCFHQGGSNNGALHYNIFDGESTWGTDQVVSGTGMSGSPSPVVFKEKIYCFHHGWGDNAQLWYNVFDGGKWEGDTRVPDTNISGSPSAVVFEDKIYCYHQGWGNSGKLWCNVYDGKNWGGDKEVSGINLTDSPASLVFSPFPGKPF